MPRRAAAPKADVPYMHAKQIEAEADLLIAEYGERYDLVVAPPIPVDELAELHLQLSREENGAGGKSDTLPDQWFADKDEAYLERHLVPADPELWKIERFGGFIEARKLLITERFKWLLAPSGSAATSQTEVGKQTSEGN